MATRITYSTATKKKYKTYEWAGRGSSTGALRALKMLAPRCEICQTPEVVSAESPTRWTWMKDCSHDPYGSMRHKVLKTPKISIDEDGDEILEEVVTRTKLIRFPNVVEIPISERFDDGEAVQKAQRHGFLTMQEGGYAPMCQMYGCGKAWPTIHTDGSGDYCSEAHAKLCVAESEGLQLVVNNTKLLKQQMREVEV